MRLATEELLDAYLARHWGVVSRREALAIGVNLHEITWALRTGRWVSIHRGVYARAAAPPGPEGRILAACLAAGPDAVASHRSAAYLWGLLPRAPTKVSLTVPGPRRSRHPGIEVHRSASLTRAQLRSRGGVPTTDPCRTIVDVAADATDPELDELVDRGRLARTLTIDGLRRAASDLSCPGRRGPGAVLLALERRGLLEAPAPSVLESRAARLLHSWGIPVVSVEHVVLGGRYRLDFLLTPSVALEVDGYAFHSSPEAKAADAGRRAALAARGITVVEADWVTVTRHPDELRRRILGVLRRHTDPGATD